MTLNQSLLRRILLIAAVVGLVIIHVYFDDEDGSESLTLEETVERFQSMRDRGEIDAEMYEHMMQGLYDISGEKQQPYDEWKKRLEAAGRRGGKP